MFNYKKILSVICICCLLLYPANFVYAESNPEVDATGDLQMFGDAQKVDDGSIMLTPLATYKSGSVWFTHQINVENGFETSFDFWAGGGRSYSYGGADGICLTFSASKGLGSDAEYLGFVTGEKSYGVELDSFPYNPNDIQQKHIAIINDRVSNHLKTVADDRVDDSQWHNLKVTYDYQNTKMSVYLDKNLVLESSDVALSLNTYLGISAATGAGVNYHYIKNFYFSGYVSEEESFSTNPIVVIPGIMGSRLFSSDTVFDRGTCVWDPIATAAGISGLGDRLKTSNTLYVRPCENQNIDTTSNTSSTVANYGREYGAQDTYQTLVDSLCDAFPYSDETAYRPVYVFSYDWRFSNTKSAQKLNTEIQNILKETGASKVDLVCHSMGGLVASSYYSQYGSNNNVDKIITCGTPYEGAPKLIDAVVNWNVLGSGASLTNEDDRNDLGLGIIGGLTTSVKKTFDGVCELTPTKNYVSELKMEKDSLWIGFGDYKLSYQQYTDICRSLFGETRYNNAVTFQEGLHAENGYNKLLGYKNAYFVIGTNHKTISAVRFQCLSDDIETVFYESDLGYDTLGDGTVPYYSASICEQIPTLDSTHYLTLNANHGETQSNSSSIEWITDILKKGNSAVESYNIEPNRYTVIRIACPVDVSIKCNGEELSSNASSFNTETSFGRLDVIGTEDDPIKMVCIDSSSDYNITITGTGEGTMDYSIRYFSEDGTLVSSDEITDVPITPSTVITTTANEKETTTLSLDTDGDGTIDSLVTKDGTSILKKADDQSTSTTVPATTPTVENPASGLAQPTISTSSAVKKNDIISVKGIKYKITNTNKKTVSVVKTTKNTVKKVTIPAAIKINNETYKVTAIGNNAFKNCKKLKSVSLGKNVSKIGKNAFKNCKKLKKVKILNKNLKKKFKLRT